MTLLVGFKTTPMKVLFAMQVYAVGGCNGTTELATVECYDPALLKWTKVTSLTLARSNTGQFLSVSNHSAVATLGESQGRSGGA